jgi:hypothetical protein
MIDLATVRLEGVVAGAVCSGQGAPIVSSTVADVNGDGFPDLNASFQVQQALIQRGDNQACVTGWLQPVGARVRRAPFEARDALSVRRSDDDDDHRR